MSNEPRSTGNNDVAKEIYFTTTNFKALLNPIISRYRTTNQYLLHFQPCFSHHPAHQALSNSPIQFTFPFNLPPHHHDSMSAHIAIAWITLPIACNSLLPLWSTLSLWSTLPLHPPCPYNLSLQPTNYPYRPFQPSNTPPSQANPQTHKSSFPHTTICPIPTPLQPAMTLIQQRKTPSPTPTVPCSPS